MAGKDRKKQLARQRYERQMQRRAARQAQARRMKVIGTVAAVAVIAGGGGAIAFAMNKSDTKKSTATASASKSPTAQPSVSVKPGECAYQPLSNAQGAKDVGKPPVKPVKGTYEMTIDTSQGKIVAKLDGTKASCTVNSFKYLASKKFFDNTKCHRLDTGIKVLQCGDPTATGSGGPAYGFGNENVPKADASGQATYKRGMIAMAHSSQPNSNGSQFFIMYGDSPLPADYTVFGEITEGLGVVDSVAKAGATAADPQSGMTAPKKKIEIKHLTVAKMG
ncbi:peptidylprolyl isomerase [Actinoallomurus purpureus]|uniref:peptidylprolyl isomerase n=1 Tax=Actinoallomurus purpureus TaxID=478114 RepID=UPI0020923273|nr:peptidylprolyl isomerase [Actinoallomurus purpureus]MCO6011381.1 peptidylprolyl isomerase [Actinoallomurus purpureus]